jgi:hypothetical protein
MQCSTLLEHKKSFAIASLDLTLPEELAKKINPSTTHGPYIILPLALYVLPHML